MELCQGDCALGYGGLSANRPVLYAMVSSISKRERQALPDAISKTADNDNVAACDLYVFDGTLGKSIYEHWQVLADEKLGTHVLYTPVFSIYSGK